jgi:hypothetical protein
MTDLWYYSDECKRELEMIQKMFEETGFDDNVELVETVKPVKKIETIVDEQDETYTKSIIPKSLVGLSNVELLKTLGLQLVYLEPMDFYSKIDDIARLDSECFNQTFTESKKILNSMYDPLFFQIYYLWNGVEIVGQILISLHNINSRDEDYNPPWDKNTRKIMTTNNHYKMAYICMLCIKKEYRGKSLSYVLLNTVSNYYGYLPIYLHVKESNKIAQKTYKNNGFVIVDKIIDYYHEDKENGFLMIKNSS